MGGGGLGVLGDINLIWARRMHQNQRFDGTDIDVAMMTTYHVNCGAVVRISPGVLEVPGSNPRWNFFPSFILIRPIIITLINFFYFLTLQWVELGCGCMYILWELNFFYSLGVAVLGVCIHDFWTIFFLLSVSARLKKRFK